LRTLAARHTIPAVEWRCHEGPLIEDVMPAGQTILLIEDDREIATTLLKVLEGAGYSVQWGQNGLEGRRLAESLSPDLVITDMMMPKMGGFPVLEFLKSLPRPPKVIMITANEGGRHKAYAEMLGVDDYLRKPFAMDVLLEAVERALSNVTSSAEKSGPEKLRRAIRKKST
jgi:DNA-binding response OmpR family regulator